MRCGFGALARLRTRWPLLRRLGGGLSVWIAVRSVRTVAALASETRYGASPWEAVWIIIIADVTMSLDNVLAIAAAAHGDLVLVMFGIGLSLPIVIWGAGILAVLMNRYAWIVWAGGGLLGYVAGEMIMEDPMVGRALGPLAATLHRPVSAGLAAIITALGWYLARVTRHHGHVPERL